MERAAPQPGLLAWPPRGGGWFVLGGGLAVVAALFAGAAHAWYLPNEPEGLWNEASIATLALFTALAVFAALRATILPLLAWTLLPALWAGAYALAGAVDLRVSANGLAFGGPRSYLYAPDACGFTVRLPARPAENRQMLPTAPGHVTEVTVASLSDFPTASAYRVECVSLASGADRDAVFALARERAEAWAHAGKLEVEHVEAIDGPPPELRVTARKDGRDAMNEPRTARMVARIVIGPDSMATLLASRLDGEVPDESVVASLAPRAN
ncbi:MAG: hypothetical protein AB7M05_14825 [Alphaproteobacteria bacterium]